MNIKDKFIRAKMARGNKKVHDRGTREWDEGTTYKRPTPLMTFTLDSARILRLKGDRRFLGDPIKVSRKGFLGTYNQIVDIISESDRVSDATRWMITSPLFRHEYCGKMISGMMFGVHDDTINIYLVLNRRRTDLKEVWIVRNIGLGAYETIARLDMNTIPD